jgi:3-oxoacyl-[acyl-carrier-protein] synthase III
MQVQSKQDKIWSPTTLEIKFETQEEFNTFKEVINLAAKDVGTLVTANRNSYRDFDVLLWNRISNQIWNQIVKP